MKPKLPSGKQVAEWGAFLVGLALLAATVWLGVNLLAKVVLVFVFGYASLLGEVLFNWHSLLLLAVVVALVFLWGRTPGLPSLREFRRHWLRWLVGVGVCIWLFADSWAFRAPLFVNAWGFRVDEMSDEHWVDEDHPHRPKALVRTNAFGFRDEPFERTPPEGTHRVVVIGDSYVYGKGVPETEGVIDRRLETALATAAPAERWEVINLGYPGHGFLSYFELATIAIEELRPEVVVVCSLGQPDWELFEVQQQFRALGEPLFRLLSAFGVTEDLRRAAVLYAQTVYREPEDPAGVAAVTARVEQALAAAEAAGAEIVLWEWYDPFPFFDRFVGRPRFHRSGWPEGFPRGWNEWGKDPELSIPNDFHPTGKANALAAKELAPLVVRLTSRVP